MNPFRILGGMISCEVLIKVYLWLWGVILKKFYDIVRMFKIRYFKIILELGCRRSIIIGYYSELLLNINDYNRFLPVLPC